MDEKIYNSLLVHKVIQPLPSKKLEQARMVNDLGYCRYYQFLSCKINSYLIFKMLFKISLIWGPDFPRGKVCKECVPKNVNTVSLHLEVQTIKIQGGEQDGKEGQIQFQLPRDEGIYMFSSNDGQVPHLLKNDKVLIDHRNLLDDDAWEKIRRKGKKEKKQHKSHFCCMTNLQNKKDRRDRREKQGRRFANTIQQRISIRLFRSFV